MAESGIALLKAAAHEALTAIARRDRTRELQVANSSAGMIDLTHNDYLGLRTDAHFQALARREIAHLPVGSGASRLLGGEFKVFQEIETQFARFKGTAAALFFSSGYAANLALLSSLGRLGYHFFVDTLSHASIHDGLRLACHDRERRQFFPHQDLNALEQALANSTGRYKAIVTESIFSMDGDASDIEALSQLANQNQALLIIDEAHALGCYGHEGRGLISGSKIAHHESVTVNPCGKALAVQGAFVAGPDELRSLMINTARPFIYSTAPSPWAAAAVRIAIEYAAALDGCRSRLWQRSAVIRGLLENQGLSLPRFGSHIFPILCGSEENAIALSYYFQENKIFSKPIRPPTVPAGTSRLRLALHAGLSDDDFSRLTDVVRTLPREFLQ